MDIKVKEETILDLLKPERAAFAISERPITRVIDEWHDGVPDYLVKVYDWAYVTPKWVDLLDRNAVVRFLLFGNDKRLMRCYLDEIGDVSRNPRFFRHPSSSPATSASRSINLPSLWKV